MIVKQIVCNRCTTEIVDKHPDKIVLSSWGKIDKYGKTIYGNQKTIHLCPKCREQFESFMCVFNAEALNES